jgi:mevalonate kinase
VSCRVGQAIEVLGVVNFLEFYGAHVQKMRIDDEVEVVVQATFLPALRATDSGSGSSAAAAASVVGAVLQTLGLLGSLWSPARLATWVEEYSPASPILAPANWF